MFISSSNRNQEIAYAQDLLLPYEVSSSNRNQEIVYAHDLVGHLLLPYEQTL